MKRTHLIPVALVVGLVVTGCGPTIQIPKIHVPKFQIPKSPGLGSSSGSGDTADFFFDPEHVTITQSGRIQVDFGVPALRYSGPLGCRGRTFSGGVTENINFVFRYGSRGAWLGWDNGNIWHFTDRPTIAHGRVTFAQRFPDGRHMVIVLHCRPPPKRPRL